MQPIDRHWSYERGKLLQFMQKPTRRTGAGGACTQRLRCHWRGFNSMERRQAMGERCGMMGEGRTVTGEYFSALLPLAAWYACRASR